MPSDQPRVALFVTCLVDLHRPTVGFAAIRLLEQAGCQVEVPRAQTCCGQPAYNSGDRATARDLGGAILDAFGGYDYVVVPSGSCGGMLKHHLPHLFDDDPNLRARADALAERTYRAGQLPGRCHAGRAPADAAYWRPCHLSRRLFRPARARHQGAAASPAAGDWCHCHRDGGCGSLLRLRRHVLREISRHLHADGVRQGARHRRNRR